MSDSALPTGLRTGGADITVTLSDGRGSYSLVATNGVLDLVAERLESAQLALRRTSTGSIFELLPAPQNGADVAAQMVVSRPGHAERPHPPFDVAPETDEAVTMPGVDVTIQFQCFDSPLGDLQFVEEFVDGLMMRRSAGIHEQPDVTVTATFEQLMRGYDPHITSLEAITGMHVTGQDRTLMMVVAGLYDSRRFRHRLWRRHREQALLVTLASHTNTEVWRQATAVLR